MSKTRYMATTHCPDVVAVVVSVEEIDAIRDTKYPSLYATAIPTHSHAIHVSGDE